MLKQLSQEYLMLFEENISILIEYYQLSNKGYKIFPDSCINEDFKKSVEEYFSNSKSVFKLYNYILKNHSKLDEEDVYEVLDYLFDRQYEHDSYINTLFDQFQLAIDMEFEDKFYLPKNIPSSLTDKDILNLKANLQGFNKAGLKRFLISEGVYSEEDFAFINNFIKEIDVDVREKINVFGTCFAEKLHLPIPVVKEIILPKINSDLSMLICIHELVHVILIGLSDELVGYNALNEDIPRLYEGVYKLTNPFVKEEVKHTNISKILLNEYKHEPIMEQIEKYKYYVKKTL